MIKLTHWLVLLMPFSLDAASGAPLCESRVLRSVEFSGRVCAGICRVLRKRAMFVGDKVLFGEQTAQSGAVFLLNGDTDLQNDQFNLPDSGGQHFPNTRSFGVATSKVLLPDILLSIRRQLLSTSNQIVADYRENLAIRLNAQCDECRVVEYRFTLMTSERNVVSAFQQYSCRVSSE